MKSLPRISTICLILILLSTLNSLTASQTKKSKNDVVKDEVLATVGSEKITYNLLEQAFQKNMNRRSVKLSEIGRDSLMDFLNLYLNYRLKVLDAIDRGYDKDSAVLADINQNRKILAESYYYDKVIVEPNVEHLLKYRQSEIKFGYILIPFDNTAPIPDTTDSHKKGMEALKKLSEGKSFGEVAEEYSVDKESAKNGGIVEEYITGGRIQRAIEDALYSIKYEGEVYPNLIKTRYGYFIVKLVKREPRTKVAIRHILITEKEGRDSLAALAKADSLIKLLNQGADFAKLATENSDDPATNQKGGSWGANYSRSSGFEGNGRRVATPVESVAFTLKDGKISDKVVTDYGIHIVKRDSTIPFDFQAEKDELKKMYKRLYYEEDKKVHLDTLKYKYGFQVYNSTLNQFLALLDTTKTSLDTAWKKNINESIRSEKLFKINNNDVVLDKFIKDIDSKNELKGTPLNYEGMMRAINKLAVPVVFEEETKDLESKYPDFASLMREFRDGILLFRVEALEVWDKLKFDSAMAKVYWDSTQTRYKTEPKYDLTEIYVLADTTANNIYKQIQGGTNFDTLAAQQTQRAGYREKKGAWGAVSIKDNGLAKLVEQNGGKPGDIMKPLQYEKGYSIIKVNSFEPVRQKTFEEAISDFAPAFQDLMQKYYTEKWLSQTRKKFPVKLSDKALNKIAKK